MSPSIVNLDIKAQIHVQRLLLLSIRTKTEKVISVKQSVKMRETSFT